MKHTFYEVTSYYHNEPRTSDMDLDVLKRTQILITATNTATENVKENDETNSIRKHIITELKTFKAQICTKKGDSSQVCNYEGCKNKLLSQHKCAYHKGIDIGLKESKDESSNCFLTMCKNETLKKMVPYLAMISGGYGSNKEEAHTNLEELAKGTDLEEFIGKEEDYKGLSQYGARNLLYVCARRLV